MHTQFSSYYLRIYWYMEISFLNYPILLLSALVGSMSENDFKFIPPLYNAVLDQSSIHYIIDSKLE